MRRRTGLLVVMTLVAGVAFGVVLAIELVAAAQHV